MTAAYNDRLDVIDISNPTQPKFVASLRDTTNLRFPVDVVVRGNDAYVVDQINTGRLTVVDISNPLSPKVVTSLADPSLNGAYRVGLGRRLRLRVLVQCPHRRGRRHLQPSCPADRRDLLRCHAAQSDHRPGRRHHRTVRDRVFALPLNQVVANLSAVPAPAGGTHDTGTVTDITLDPSPIAVSISPASEPPSTTSQTTANFSFSASDAVAALRCQIDGGPFTPCASATSQSYASLQSGSHTFVVQATDSAGNVATDSYTWSIAGPSDTSPTHDLRLPRRGTRPHRPERNVDRITLVLLSVVTV